jgi:hypothetical protein
MSNLLSQDQAALQMLFTEDIYFLQADKEAIPAQASSLPVQPAELDNIKSAEALKEDIGIPVQADFEYQGENNKYFLVLIDDKIHTRMNPVHLEMLLKVMGAKKLELRDLAILNINRYPGLKYTALKTFFSCNRLAMFGVTPEQIAMPAVKPNKAETVGNVKVLVTYSLEEMRNNADKKREFWNVMKNL